MNLTDEEIRIAVAEACGWTHVQPTRYHGIKIIGVPPNAGESDLNFPTSDPDIWCALVPNYPEDLNACAEFEATLAEDELETYREHISELLNDTARIGLGFTAKPKIRCIAYLKTKGILL